MSIFFLLICVLFSSFTFALNMTTQIHSLDISSTPGEPTLVFLTSGHVGKLSQQKSIDNKWLKMAQEEKTWLNVTMGENRELITIVETDLPYEEKEAQAPLELNQNFTPSVLGSIEWANLYFKEARYNTKESQCFNRAHVWTHDWRINHTFYSSKIFIFFTQKYIREYDFEWWFHVAPYVHVLVDGFVKQRVMDIKYARGPITIRHWTNIFMKNDVPCPTVTQYSDYANYPEAGHCFTMKSSMYYYQPVDLEMLELKEIKKSTWLPAEVKEAYLEAFDVVL